MGCMSSKPYYGPNAPRDPMTSEMKTPAGNGQERQHNTGGSGLDAMK